MQELLDPQELSRSKIGSYPKVYNLGHAQIGELFLDDVTVQEKIDGSQVSFTLNQRDGHGLVIRSKGAAVYDDSLGGEVGSGQFGLAVAQLLERRNLLHEGWVYRGEYLSKPKHNTLAYDRVPEGNIILFDIEVGDQRYLRWDDMFNEAKRIGLEVVPMIGPNRGWTLDLMQMYVAETMSVLGGQKIEGLVFKNYDRFGRDGKVLMGKHVSEAFKETNKKDFKERNPGGGDIVERLGQALRTTARWDKAVQHLRDHGELQMAPQDIGPLLKELKQDITEEEEDYIISELLKWALPRILRIATAGFPEWYKNQLAEAQFFVVSAGIEEAE